MVENKQYEPIPPKTEVVLGEIITKKGTRKIRIVYDEGRVYYDNGRVKRLVTQENVRIIPIDVIEVRYREHLGTSSYLIVHFVVLKGECKYPIHGILEDAVNRMKPFLNPFVRKAKAYLLDLFRAKLEPRIIIKACPDINDTDIYDNNEK